MFNWIAPAAAAIRSLSEVTFTSYPNRSMALLTL